MYVCVPSSTHTFVSILHFTLNIIMFCLFFLIYGKEHENTMKCLLHLATFLEDKGQIIESAAHTCTMYVVMYVMYIYLFICVYLLMDDGDSKIQW